MASATNGNQNVKGNGLKEMRPFLLFNDVYLITGDIEGTNFQGHSFTKEITIPVRYEIGCSNLFSRAVEIIVKDQPSVEYSFINSSTHFKPVRFGKPDRFLAEEKNLLVKYFKL